MSHEFVAQMMEKSRLGELRSPVSETLEMRLVELGRGEAIYEMAAREERGNPLGVIQGLYQWELYAQLSTDPTGLSLPVLMEELFWGCAGIGLSIVMPALALAAIRQ